MGPFSHKDISIMTLWRLGPEKQFFPWKYVKNMILYFCVFSGCPGGGYLKYSFLTLPLNHRKGIDAQR